MFDYSLAVNEIVGGVVAREAVAVDRDAEFPRAAVKALGDSGLLGLVSAAEVGGKGEGIRAAAHVVERIARECGSTAMVVCMHYAATAVVEALAPESIRRQVAGGEHLLTLAFSERGSRSQFWAPVSTARKVVWGVRLDADKSWVTSANHATAYVWSSRPVSADGASTIWWVPRDTAGICPSDAFDGLGLRGNDSTPVVADNAVVPLDNMLGDDGSGLAVMLEVVLPMFNILVAACGVGLMEGATSAACAHVSNARYQHLDSSLADLPTIRAYLARMQISTDQARCLMADAIEAVDSGREDALLRVLEAKAAAGESATSVLDTAMRVCGGAAFRKDVGVERRFRDARAGTVMAPTTDQLYDFIGKALCGLPVF